MVARVLVSNTERLKRRSCRKLEVHDEYYREYTRTTWNETASVWVEWLDSLKPFGDVLLKGTAAKAGETILDMGTGSGDLSEKMIEIALKAAGSMGLSNVSFRVMDAESLDFQTGMFDLALSRFGFQIFTNPQRAATEALRVLRPEGRLGATVWSTADRIILRSSSTSLPGFALMRPRGTRPGSILVRKSRIRGDAAIQDE